MARTSVMARGLLFAGLCGCGGRSGISDRAHAGDADAMADSGPLPCAVDSDCDDGLLCTGVEACVDSFCAPGTPVECPSDDTCVMGVCEEASGCVYRTTDEDDDGHTPPACGGDDCDDTRAEVHPGAEEICDYLDNDCNETVDDGWAYRGIGNVLDLSAPQGNGRSPDVRFDGQDFDVVFDSWPAQPSQVFYVAVAADGSSASDPVQRTFSTVLSSSADLEWNGSEYGLFAHFHLLDVANAGAIALTRLHADGSINVNTVEITDDNPDADSPSAAWDGQGWGIAYVENHLDGTHPIRFIRTTVNGLPLGPGLQLSPGAAIMIKPSVVWTGTGFAVAYVEALVSVEVDISLVAGGSVAWTSTAGRSSVTAPALVSADGTTVVAWASNSGSVEMATLDDNGNGSTPLTVAQDGTAAALGLAWGGREFGVSYQTSGGGTRLTRVGPSLGWVSPPGTIDAGFERADARTAVDFNGQQYGVAYTAGAMDSGRIEFRLAGCPE